MLSVFLLTAIGLSEEETEPAQWRYTFDEPSGDWTAAEFDDSQWQRGAPGFGNQELPAFQRGRVKTEWSTPDIWIRFGVDLLDTPWWAALVFSHDEDLEIYVNGSLTVEEKGFITGYAQRYLDCGAGGILEPGRNLVAAHCVQRTGGQFVDIAFESYRGETRITPPGDAIPRPEYPRPQLKRNGWLNLNGTWEFEIDRKGTGLERGLHRGKRLKGRITVPFAPESTLSGVGETDFLRRVWYFRGVQIPESWEGQRILLHFGAVDYTTTVWVNGRQAGGHRGGFTPFCIDITPYVVDGYAGITVLAEDAMDDGLQVTGKQSRKPESHGCVYTRTTGIWQTVWLEPVPTVRVSALRVEGLPDQNQVLVNVQLEGAAAGAVVHGSVYLGGDAMGEASAPARWRGTRLAIPLSKVKLWNPGDPHLYDHAHESPAVMTIPLAILAVGAAVTGFLGIPESWGFGHNLFEHFLEPVVGKPHHGMHVSHAMEVVFIGLSIFAGVAGLLLAAWLYLRDKEIPDRIVKSFPALHRAVYNKYYVDELYDYLFVRPIHWISVRILWKIMDVFVVDDGMVNGTARFFKQAAQRLRRLQVGDVQSYAFAMALGILAIIGFLLLK